MEDLEQIARDCPLVSIKIGFYPYSWFGNFLREATRLQEFWGGDFSIRANLPAGGPNNLPAGGPNNLPAGGPNNLPAGGPNNLPAGGPNNLPAGGPFGLPIGRFTSLAPIDVQGIHSYEVSRIAPFFLKLDLSEAQLNLESYGVLLLRCYNLQELKVTELIGDGGLHVVASTCKRLKKLHITSSGFPFPLAADIYGITEIGIMRIADHCHELECLRVYVAEIGNLALEYIGRYLKHLKHFELHLLYRSRDVPDFPLDHGVRALLQGCQNIRRLCLLLVPGALTDTGLGYIGQYGNRIRRLTLWAVGGTDAGLLNLSNGCCQLQMLEIWWCNFSLQAISTAARRLPLRYISVEGYRVTQLGDLYFQGLSRENWIIEQIILPAPPFLAADKMFLAYFSIAGRRPDAPSYVFTFGPGPRP